MTIEKLKILCPGDEDEEVGEESNEKEIFGTFLQKELQKINQREFRIERIIKKLGEKLYVKWKGYDN